MVDLLGNIACTHHLLTFFFKFSKMEDTGHSPKTYDSKHIIHLLCKAAFIYSRNRADKWNNTLHSNCMFIHWVMHLRYPARWKALVHFSVTVAREKRKKIKRDRVNMQKYDVLGFRVVEILFVSKGNWACYDKDVVRKGNQGLLGSVIYFIKPTSDNYQCLS